MKIIVLLCVLLLSSCSMMTPKADQSKVKMIDAKVATLAFKKQKKIANSRSNLIPLRRGQWVITLDVDKKSGEKSIIIRKIVRVTKKTVTMEMETYSSSSQHPKLPSVVQQVISGYPHSFKVSGKNNFMQLMSKFKIISMKIKDGNEPVRDVSGMGQSPLVSAGLQGVLKSIKFGKVSKIKCETKYLKSNRCYKQPLEMGILGMSFKGVNMQHSRVPIVGFISSDSEQIHSEVIAYGFKGRKVIIK